jgi:probable rRNA maturation factor
MPVLLDVSRAGAGAERYASLLKRRSAKFLRALKLSKCELSVTLVGDAEIRRLNRAWRKKDKATDVLSFPAGEWLGAGRRPLGDVVISLATTRRAAKEYGHTIEHELTRYLAHGVLHLLGHDHHRKADAEKMRRAERKLLGRPGML